MIREEIVKVPAHTTRKLIAGEWTFWRVRTGCVRVQLGHMTAYLQADEAKALALFIERTHG